MGSLLRWDGNKGLALKVLALAAGPRAGTAKRHDIVLGPGQFDRLVGAHGSRRPVGVDAIGKGPRLLDEQSFTLDLRFLAKRLVALAAAFHERRGVLGAAEGHGWRRDKMEEHGDIVILAKQL